MEFLSLGYLLDSEMEPVCLLKVLLLIILNSEVSWGIDMTQKESRISVLSVWGQTHSCSAPSLC